MTFEADWIGNLSEYGTLDELRRSAFYAASRARILSYLETPQFFLSGTASPRLQAFLRVAQWNIEKGRRFDSILGLLGGNDILKWADIVILNEADYGMARSGNRHVARELAERLGMHMVFGPAHFELTKGTEEDLAAEGGNRESIQGNAVLSRYPVLDAAVIPLPGTFEPYEFGEKRFGGRCCLWAKIQLGRQPVWVGSVHLELRNTPRCRAVQVQHIIENLPGGEKETFLLGGDLNTNGFRRGTGWRTILSISRILLHRAAKIKEQLLHPEKGREPLFDTFRRNGFFWEGLNSNEETARSAIHALEESALLPGFLMDAVQKRLKPYNGYLCFKLDWFLGKNLRALGDGEKLDAGAGTASRRAGSLKGKNYGPGRASDHLPIYADIDLQ
ncbi:MAG: endonuclease/exonuclease/phosphatase family protein [Acidobacteria bacterium]|nr:endonuclease/exonuclease/phosphatase family protein [Acidobacteriota bacterium]